LYGLQHRYYISGNSVPQWINYTDVQTENSYRACGYKAGDVVTYGVRAGTKAGYGPEITGDVRVTCGCKFVKQLCDKIYQFYLASIRYKI